MIANNNEVIILWVPAHAGVEGNEVADGMAKEAAENRTHAVPDEIRWQASLPHLARQATEDKVKATSQWISDHVHPECQYHPPSGTGLCKALRRTRKSTAQRYYQLLSGHAAIGSFLHDRMTGPQRLESDECWWCRCGKRQTRHHLFTECRAWAPQIKELWKRIGKGCKWEHPRAPSVSKVVVEGGGY